MKQRPSLNMQTDKRKQARQNREESIYIEVLVAGHQPSQDNYMLECTTKDISTDGLKVHVTFPLIVDSVFELIIAFESGGYKFLLTGQVKWLDKIGDDEYHAGFKIVEAEHSDFAEWRNMFSD